MPEPRCSETYPVFSKMNIILGQHLSSFPVLSRNTKISEITIYLNYSGSYIGSNTIFIFSPGRKSLAATRIILLSMAMTWSMSLMYQVRHLTIGSIFNMPQQRQFERSTRRCRLLLREIILQIRQCSIWHRCHWKILSIKSTCIIQWPILIRESDTRHT